MKFNEWICSDQRALDVRVENKNYKFRGNDREIIVRNNAELFVVVRSGISKRGIFENYDGDEKVLYLDGDEIPAKQIVFVGTL